MKNKLEEIVPNEWETFIFGSSARCALSAIGCVVENEGSDLDLLIVYPSRYIEEGLRIRQEVFTALNQQGVVADVVLLNDREHDESDFARRECAIPLPEVAVCSAERS